VADVRGDLQAAAADGVGPAVLIGPDVDAFARRAIEEGGYRPRPGDYARVVTGAVLGAVVTVVAGFLLVVVVLQPALASWFTLDGHYPAAGPVVVYGATGLLGSLVTLGRVLTGRPAARATVRRAALLTPLGVAAGVVAATALAHRPGYPIGAGSIAPQALCVVLPFVAALLVSRWWALRASAGSDDPARAESVLT
jgi:hypothetical protein